jgi:hypothetical protein
VVRIFVDIDGSPTDMVAFTGWMSEVTGNGSKVLMENPAVIAQGKGRFLVEVPQAETRDEAIAIVRASIDQVPAVTGVLSVSEETEGTEF